MAVNGGRYSYEIFSGIVKQLLTMPSLILTVKDNAQEILVMQDIKAQHMRLRGVSVSWGLPTLPATVLQNGALVDLSELGASSRQITGFTPEYGPHSYLYLPRPGFMDHSTPADILQTNVLSYYTPLNLGFDSDDIRRSFVVRTFANDFNGGAATFGAAGLQEFTLYCDYDETDVHS